MKGKTQPVLNNPLHCKDLYPFIDSLRPLILRSYWQRLILVHSLESDVHWYCFQVCSLDSRIPYYFPDYSCYPCWARYLFETCICNSRIHPHSQLQPVHYYWHANFEGLGLQPALNSDYYCNDAIANQVEYASLLFSLHAPERTDCSS